MGSMRVLHAFLCLVRWSKLQLQGRRCICIVSRSWWWSKPAVVVWAKSAEGGSSQKLSLLVFLANAANEQFRKRKHFNINTLQNRWKLMYCRTLKTPRLCPKWMCSYSGHNATVRICVLISTTSRPYVLKIFCEGCGMMNVNVWYSKDLKVPCCSSLHLFLPNNRTATMTSGAAFVSYFLRWDEIFNCLEAGVYLILRRKTVQKISSPRLKQTHYFGGQPTCQAPSQQLWDNAAVVHAFPLSKSSPSLSLTLCSSLWHCVGGPGGTTGTSPPCVKLVI